jgi:DnaK suppressor protein
MSGDTDLDLEGVRAGLIEERRSLMALSDSARQSRDPVTLDQASVGRLSRMDAIQLQAMAIESERRRQVQIRRIDAAVKRIDEGEYGYCARCGDDISPDRLKVDPTAPFCTACMAGRAE